MKLHTDVSTHQSNASNGVVEKTMTASKSIQNGEGTEKLTEEREKTRESPAQRRQTMVCIHFQPIQILKIF